MRIITQWSDQLTYLHEYRKSVSRCLFPVQSFGSVFRWLIGINTPSPKRHNPLLPVIQCRYDAFLLHSRHYP